MIDLIAKIESAAEGSMGISREIALVAGWHRITPAQMGRHHRSKGAWIAPQDWIGRHGDGKPILDSLRGTEMWRDPPHFSRSIDAALPWENIVQVTRIADDFWHAVHEAPDGTQTEGNGRNEACARRAAALKARTT